jgi:GxxExxY protein
MGHAFADEMLRSSTINRITHRTIGAAMRVHRKVGPGLLESAYQLCFGWELNQTGLRFVSQHAIPLVYGNFRLERCYRLDFLVEDLVVVEVKALDRLLPVHRAQMLTYLRLTGCPVGLVLSFCAPVLKDGIMRVANGEVDGEERDGIEDAEVIEDADKIGDDETQRR